MFNTSYYKAGNHTNNIKANAVTGAILKNHPNSWFERFHLNSNRAKELLVENGHHAKKKVYDDELMINVTVDDHDKSIIILQMVICGDMEVIAELVYAKDYKMVQDMNNKIKDDIGAIDIKQFVKDVSVSEGYLQDWYQASVDDSPPVWTDDHIEELYNDFYLIPKEAVNSI